MNADFDTITFDEEMLIGVMLGCIMRRLKDRGWNKGQAERAAGKTVSKALTAARKMAPNVIREAAGAAGNGASPAIAHTMMISAYAMAGVAVADEMFAASVAENN